MISAWPKTAYQDEVRQSPLRYGSGACEIKHRDFALATAIGTIPGLVTFVYLGSAITEPKYFMLVILFLIIGWALSKFFRTKTRHLNLNLQSPE
jgi:uncharacterized membrane protein YdjX (TVP38/TMEM64 family)